MLEKDRINQVCLGVLSASMFEEEIKCFRVGMPKWKISCADVWSCLKNIFFPWFLEISSSFIAAGKIARYDCRSICERCFREHTINNYYRISAHCYDFACWSNRFSSRKREREKGRKKREKKGEEKKKRESDTHTAAWKKKKFFFCVLPFP